MEERQIVTRRYEDETRRYAEMDVDAFVTLLRSLEADMEEVFSNDNIPDDIWRQRVRMILKNLYLAVNLVG